MARLPGLCAGLLVAFVARGVAEERVAALPGGVPLPLVRIAEGRFTMGDDKGNMDERPARQVVVPRAFWLGKTEVTQAQWQAVMGANPSEFKGPRRPVENVSWLDAHEFLKLLNARATDFTFRLPTETEWEYACRAGSTTRYHFGEDAGLLWKHAWFRGNSGSRKVFGWLGITDGLNRTMARMGFGLRLRTWGTSDAGLWKPNAWGLCDMHGSVWEWCEDRYAGGPQAPLSPGAPEMRVLRGGSWYSIELDCRSSNRSRYPPTERSNVTGLRLAAEPRR